jgi:hypothetical protein
VTDWHLVEGDRPRLAMSTARMIGPYFAIRLGEGSPGMGAEEFFQPSRLRGLVDDVACRIGADESRVAASSIQYEIAERLWSVILGTWVMDGLIADLRPLRYGRSPVGRIRLSLEQPAAWERPDATPVETASVIAGVVVARLTSLHLALREVVRVADGLLWGNAATALTLATQALANRGTPDRGLVAVSRSLLEIPPLAERLDGDLTGRIVRRTCCLYYRTAARRACGDCPLIDSAVVRNRS